MHASGHGRDRQYRILFYHTWLFHTIETMTSTTRSIACTFCHHPFSTQEELSRHMVIHRREERPFKCRICGKSFKQQAHRDAHIRTHTNDRPYACQHCGQLFKQSGHLNRHCLRRHTDRRELPHSCSKCSQKFATKWDLDQHSRAHHLKGPQKYPYQCPKCERSFTQLSNLHTHLKKVDCSGKHQCPHCKANFQTGGRLRCHQRFCSYAPTVTDQ